MIDEYCLFDFASQPHKKREELGGPVFLSQCGLGLYKREERISLKNRTCYLLDGFIVSFESKLHVEVVLVLIPVPVLSLKHGGSTKEGLIIVLFWCEVRRILIYVGVSVQLLC